MRQIGKILKKYTIEILLIVVFLFIQAQADLTLPDYTSNIINVGIQQGGIENSVYEVVRSSELHNIMIFTNDEEDKIILDSYTLLSKDNLSNSDYLNYLEKYPILENEDVYILNESIKDIDSLNNILVTPSLIVSSLNDEETVKTIFPLFNGADIFEFISYMDEETINTIRDNFETKFDEIADIMLNQMSIQIVKNEYITIEYDAESLQVNYIINIGIKMILLAFLIMLIAIFTTYLSSKVAAKFSRDLRSKVVTKVMSFSNKEFDELSSASLITRSTNDIQQIQMLLNMALKIIIYAPILGLGALGKISGSSLFWIIGLAIGTILLLIIFLFAVVLPKFKVVQQLIDRINLISREIITGLPVVRAFANEKHEEERFDKANKDLTKVNLFTNRVMTIMMPTMMFIMNGVSVLIIWVGASKVDAGLMQVGDLTAFIAYTMQIIMSFLMIAMMSIMIPRAWVSVKRISEIFNKDITVVDNNNEVIKTDTEGVIEFKDVYFRYPDAEEDVLENISFKVETGTTVAFIGSTGSGKSTLINLISRLFDVTGGKILLDGINIKDYSLKDLRSRIGFVPQKGILFSGTIESNIKFGNEDLNKEQMDKASRIAQALSFIEEKEDKYNSAISQGGTNVSGGQKQRLSIARAIAIDPEIYIFDDSFSALDFRTDANLRKALKEELTSKTVLIVAQRISTVMHADKIIVMDDGNIVGIGKHKELLNNCEVYKEIALSQLSEEEL